MQLAERIADGGRDDFPIEERWWFMGHGNSGR
jgi:hypothetical protein